MLDGSALLRVFLVLVAAAVLTGLVQHYWTFENGQPEAPAMAAGPAAPPRRIEPTPSRPAAQAVAPSPPPMPAAPPVPATLPVRETDAAPAASPPPRAPIPPPPSPGPALAAPAEATDGSDEGRAVDLVDLNTASLSELNGLKGGGSIGRAIVQHRPYTSADQLLSKRVLSRAIYQRIRGQVTVR